MGSRSPMALYLIVYDVVQIFFGILSSSNHVNLIDSEPSVTHVSWVGTFGFIHPSEISNEGNAFALDSVP